MKHEQDSFTDLPKLAPVVIVLECHAELQIDPIPLAELFASQGEILAEETVSRILEDLAQRMSNLQNPRMRSAFLEIDVPANRIAVIALQIGLTEVASAARHVATAARQADGIALEATMSRLERGFDAAVSQVWNFRATF